MMRQIAPTCVAVFLSVLLPTFAAGQVAGAVDRPAITTTGEAVVYVTPDEVTLSLGIETFDPRLDIAKSQLDGQSKTLLTAIERSGVEPTSVQTAAVEVEIRYRAGDETDQIKGYVARRSYAIKVKDVGKLEAIVDAALKNGANRLFGIDYQTTELRKHRDAARKMAIKAAKEKAELLVSELDMKVGTPRQISEGSFWSGYSGGWWGGRGYGGNLMSQNAVMQVNDGGAAEGTMPLGQISIRAQVSATFEMAPQ